MRAFIIIMILLAAASPAEALDHILFSETPILLDGNWIYPEMCEFRITVDSLGILINGYEYYLPPPAKPAGAPTPPDRHKDPVTWLFHTADSTGRQIMIEGGSADEATDSMTAIFDRHLGSLIQGYEIDEGGGFRICIEGLDNSVFLRGPGCYEIIEQPRDDHDKASASEVHFEMLYVSIEAGSFMILSTTDHSIQRFTLKERDEAIAAFKDIQRNPSAYYEEGQKEPVIILGGRRIAAEYISRIVNPLPLTRRQQHGSKDRDRRSP